MESIAIGCGGGNYCPNAPVPQDLANELIQRTLFANVPVAGYHYDNPAHVHAVTSVTRGASTDTYTYDLNGNQTCRVEKGKTYIQTYNVENRMAGAQLVTGTCSAPGSTLATWTFTYDGDGNRVKEVYADGSSTITTYTYFGGAYEVTVNGSTTTTREYYSLAGSTVAMRSVTNSVAAVVYFLTDHLGSVVAVTDASGVVVSEQRYLPFGDVRTDVQGNQPLANYTDHGYTGQKDLDAQSTVYTLGLMDYHARTYDPYMGQFTQPDTTVPNEFTPQILNRFSYVGNNPSNHNDPNGHCYPLCTVIIGAAIGAMIGGIAYTIANHGQGFDYKGFAAAVGVGLVAGGLIGTGIGIGVATASLAGGATAAVVTTASVAAPLADASIAIAAGTSGIVTEGTYIASNPNKFNATNFYLQTGSSMIAGGISGDPAVGFWGRAAGNAFSAEMSYYTNGANNHTWQGALLTAGAAGALSIPSGQLPNRSQFIFPNQTTQNLAIGTINGVISSVASNFGPSFVRQTISEAK